MKCTWLDKVVELLLQIIFFLVEWAGEGIGYVIFFFFISGRKDCVTPKGSLNSSKCAKQSQG